MTARATRIGVWLVGLSALGFVAFWMLLPVFVSSEFVRTGIERELADITGQEIRVEGRVDIDLFPNPVARLNDLRIPSDTRQQGETPSDFLVVDSVEVSIPVTSLLARKPEFTQFHFIRPVMRVLVDDHGRIDLGAIGGRLGREITRVREEVSEAEDAGETPPPQSTASARQHLGTVTIDNGIVEFVTPAGEQPERITAVNGVVSWPRLDDRLTATLQGIWRGAAFQQKAEIDNALMFLSRRISGVRQSITSDILTYSFDGRLGIGEAPFAEGEVSVKTPSLRQLLEWVGADITTGGAVGSLALTGAIRGDAKKIRFENLSVTMQESTGTGVLELAQTETGKPFVTATLDFEQIDILAFLSAFSGLPRTPESMAEPVYKEILEQMDVDLRLSAKSAAAGALQFTDIAAVTQIRNGGAVFELPDATAYGGRLQAHLKLMPDDGQLVGMLGATLTDVNGGAAADALQLNGLFPRGTTSGNVTIQSPISHWSDLFRRANGEMSLVVTGGQLNGVAFRTFGGEGERQTFFRLQDNTVTSEVFDRLEINALIQDGVIIVDKGAINYPSGTVQLNGVIPYGTASLALTTIAEPRSDAETRIPPVQHFIGGSWDNPYATPVLIPHEP